MADANSDPLPDDEFQEMLAKVEQAEAEKTREMQETCQRQIREKLSNMEEYFRNTVEGSLSNVGDRYKSHARECVAERQTDILRLNKIIREVSRALRGEEWKPVFQFLMSSFPPDVVEAEIIKLEKYKPFMQAYKALMTWKEMSGQDLYIFTLSEALKSVNRIDLVERMLAILDSQGDALLTLENVGAGRTKPEGGAEGTWTENQQAEANPSAQAQLQRTPSQSGEAQGPIGDQKLLKLARQLKSEEWVKLGQALQVPEEELAEIQASETGYQAAFKVLWSWRDNLRQQSHDDVDVLIKALKDVGKEDLVTIFQE